MKELLDTFRSFDPAAFHFLRPRALWLFVALAVITVIFIIGNREQRRWRKIIPEHLRPYMFSRGSVAAIVAPLVLLALGFGFIVLALAGPTWKKRDIPGEKIPSVVMISLDMSQSMLAGDIAPSRLERAKLKISDFVDANPRARVGLIAFAGTPHTVLPFTSDYSIVKHHAKSLYNWEMPVQGTNMVLNLALIDSMMVRVDAPSAILLMTDAIDGAEAAAISDFAANSIHRFEILLFSTPAGAAVPGVKGVVSRQDESVAANLRQNPKIRITPITLDKSDVEGIAKRVSDSLMFVKDSKKDDKDWDDAGWLALIPAVIIALFWFRKGWVVQWCWLLLLVPSLGSCIDGRHASWWYTTDYRGDRAYGKGDYKVAAGLFDDVPHKAAAYYKAGDYQSVVELLAGDTTATGRYNYGLALAQLGYYDEAMEAFRDAGAKDPSLARRADHNIDASKLMQDRARSAMRFKPHINAIDSILKKTEKGALKERKPSPEDEQLSSDTEVKKLPTSGDRLSDEVASDIHRAREQKFPPKNFKLGDQTPPDTRILLQKTNADPGEFLHRRFEIQKQRYYPDVKQGKETW